MDNTFIKFIDRAVSHFTGEKTNKAGLLDYIERNQSEFFNFIRAFDEVILQLNLFLKSSDLSDSRLSKITRLKNQSILELPLLSDIIQGKYTDYFNIFSFIRTLIQYDHEMVLGEAKFREPEKYKDIKEGYFMYHISAMSNSPDPDKARLAGTLFHFYENLLRKLYRFENDLICDALVEGLCILGRSNTLFDQIASPDNLNWVIGYDGFSKELRSVVERMFSESDTHEQ